LFKHTTVTAITDRNVESHPILQILFVSYESLLSINEPTDCIAGQAQ